MKNHSRSLDFDWRGLLYAPGLAVQYLKHVLRVLPDSGNKSKSAISGSRDLLCYRESPAVQCVRHQVVLVLAVEIGEEVQVFPWSSWVMCQLS